MNVAAYLRVSTDAQDVERQNRDIAAWCTRHGHTCILNTGDKASGLKTDRTQRRFLMQQAKVRNIDAIVVTELSRWSRSVPDLLSTLETLAADGVRLIAINGPDFDIGKPLGKMMITVLGAVAEFERGLIGERVKSALDAKRARGETLGRPAGSNIRVREIQEQLRRTDTTNLSQRDIAKLLKCSRNTLTKALTL